MASSSGPGVDDTAARLIITPLVGMAVPNLAGMISHGAHSTAGLVGTYAWFIGVAFVTREANLRLYLLFQDRTAWLMRPWHRVLLQDPNATWRSIAMAVITIVAAVTFITHVYETLFLVREWKNEFQRGEHLQRLNVEAELLALKSEVNPHTLFNNLNALSHLVDQGHPRAAAFVAALGRVIAISSRPVRCGWCRCPTN